MGRFFYLPMFEVCGEKRRREGGLHSLEEGRALLGGAGVEGRPAETKKAIIGGIRGEC